MSNLELKSDSVQPGDIIGFSGNHWSSAAINLASYGIPWWSLSHVGIVGKYRGKLYLYESTTTDEPPCAIRRVRTKGTQAQNLDQRVAQYHGKVWHYPLVRPLYSFETTRLNKFLNGTLGIPYDSIGAFRAGGCGFSWLESHLHDGNLSSIFCAEWCAAGHTEIGLFKTDNVSRWSPNNFVRAERRQAILMRPRRWK